MIDDWVCLEDFPRRKKRITNKNRETERDRISTEQRRKWDSAHSSAKIPRETRFSSFHRRDLREYPFLAPETRIQTLSPGHGIRPSPRRFALSQNERFIRRTLALRANRFEPRASSGRSRTKSDAADPPPPPLFPFSDPEDPPRARRSAVRLLIIDRSSGRGGELARFSRARARARCRIKY